MTLIPSLSSLRESMVKVTRRFPSACTFAFLLAFALILMVITDEFRGVAIYYLTAGFLLSLMLSLWAEEYHNKRVVWTVTAIAHILLLIDAIYLWNLDSSRYSMALFIARAAVYVALILGILFLPFYQAKSDVKSWNFTRRMIIAMVLAYLVGGVMTGGIELLLLGIQSLFDIHIEDKLYAIVSILFALLLPLLLVLSRVPEGERKHDETILVSRFLTGTTRYLFIPLVVCYMVVLYLYLARIVFSWELPNGTITWLVTIMMFGIIAIEFLLYPTMRSKESKPFERWVVRWFPILALPLVILMTVGIVRRLGDYGITVNRLYVLTLNLWFYAVCIGLFVLKARRIHWIPLSFGAILLLTSAQPMNYCEIVRRHLRQQVSNVVAQYKPEHLPMNQQEFDSWMKTLPEDVQTATQSRLKYLDSYYNKETETWIDKDVWLRGDYSKKTDVEDEDFLYEPDTHYITLPEGYHLLIPYRNEYSFTGSRNRLNDSILQISTTGLQDENLFFEVNLEEFRRKKAQGICPIFCAEKTHGDSIVLYFERLQIRRYEDDENDIEYRANLFFK